MKRSFIALVAVLTLVLASSAAASAQGLYIKGGLTYGKSVSDLKDFDVKEYTGWQIGAGFQTESTMGFSLQPELIYTVKGAKIGEKGNEIGDLRMSYIELPVNIQWGIDFVAFKPFVFAAPYIGYNVKNAMGKDFKVLNDLLDETKKFEYGFGFGAGVELLRKIQITARYDWNFGNVNSWDEYIDSAKNVSRSTGGMVITAGLRF